MFPIGYYKIWYGVTLRTSTSLPCLMQVLQFFCCQSFQAPPRKRFQPHRWQIADWWSATPHQCLIFCSCFFLVPILFSFSFRTAVPFPLFVTTCNVAHDRWPHRFILDDIMLSILISIIPWHLFSFQITRDVYMT